MKEDYYSIVWRSEEAEEENNENNNNEEEKANNENIRAVSWKYGEIIMKMSKCGNESVMAM